MKKIKKVMYIILCGGGGFFIAEYFNMKITYLAGLIFMVILLLCLKYNNKYSGVSRCGSILFGIFASILSIAIILGFHIHVENAYAGTVEENYIIPYGIEDIVAFPFIAAAIFIIVNTIYVLMSTKKKEYTFDVQKHISYKQVLVVTIVLFVLWLPYLLIYYPGHIFGDTMTSMAQAIGGAPLNNHHPICYTLFIKLCMKIGKMFGGNTAGCVCYCIIQMIYMAASLAYISCWTYTRMSLKKIHLFLLIIFYGIVPYFAQMSIAMWKDPIFAVTLALLTIIITECVLHYEENKKIRRSFWIKYTLLLGITIFIRNNGIYISFFIGIVALLLFFLYHTNVRGLLRKFGIYTIVLAIIAQIIVGPVYDKWGIIKETAESYGIFLNQMARVVVMNGEMNVDDEAYMGQLLPLEEYKNVYSPCCVDNLKWNPNFNTAGLDNQFFKHYFSMLIKNPILFFEGWELQTYGFWTVNREEINYYKNNILGGVPRNYYPDYYENELAAYDIKAGKYINNEVLNKIFPIDDIGVGIGIITWWVILLIVILILRKQTDLLITLAPTVGMLLTLVIASPINYWPRYGAAAQYLIPFYILLFIYDNKKKGSEKIG